MLIKPKWLVWVNLSNDEFLWQVIEPQKEDAFAIDSELSVCASKNHTALHIVDICRGLVVVADNSHGVAINHCMVIVGIKFVKRAVVGAVINGVIFLYLFNNMFPNRVSLVGFEATPWNK